MKLIRPSYEIIEQGPGLQGIYDMIERCGKTSYKSEVKGGETARKFVEARSKEGHGAVLEFGTVYLTFNPGDPTTSLRGSGDDETKSYMQSRGENIDYFEWSKIITFYRKNAYSKVTFGAHESYVTTNYRVLVENNRLDDLKYLSEPTEYHEKRYSVKFITDIGLGRDFLRHRVMSMVQESTRYINYSRDKFGNEITFVIPPWITKEELAEGDKVSWWDGDWVDMTSGKMVKVNGIKQDPVDVWLTSMSQSEMSYMSLLNKKWTPQQARGVLPLSTKTEFVLCGFKDAWIHFIRLRSDIEATGKAHPMSIELANHLRDEFIERQYITDKDLEKDSFAVFDVCSADENMSL